MVNARRLAFVAVGSSMLTAISSAQVPDLLTAFDAGGRSMGAGGALNVVEADTLSSYYNPAGLGYIGQKQIGISYRNLPSSITSITGTLANPIRTSAGQRGTNAISHIGFAFPLNNNKGTIGFAYTIGGFVSDLGFGPQSGLPSDSNNTFNVTNLVEVRKARADYYTIGYGKTNQAQNLAWGAGLAIVHQTVQFTQTGTAPIALPDASGSETGVGALIGVQYTPTSTPNESWGLSYRTPINMKDSSGLFGQIPGRLMLGTSYRQDGLRGGKDFLVLGAEVQHFFDGHSSIYFDRKNQTVLGLGAEYDYSFEEFRLPLKIGYVSLPAGGSGFASRNSFTFGLGYRPKGGDYGIDLNWGSPEGSGYDFGITASYRFK